MWGTWVPACCTAGPGMVFLTLPFLSLLYLICPSARAVDRRREWLCIILLLGNGRACFCAESCCQPCLENSAGLQWWWVIINTSFINPLSQTQSAVGELLKANRSGFITALPSLKESPCTSPCGVGQTGDSSSGLGDPEKVGEVKHKLTCSKMLPQVAKEGELSLAWLQNEVYVVGGG